MEIIDRSKPIAIFIHNFYLVSMRVNCNSVSCEKCSTSARYNEIDCNCGRASLFILHESLLNAYLRRKKPKFISYFEYSIENVATS